MKRLLMPMITSICLLVALAHCTPKKQGNEGTNEETPASVETPADKPAEKPPTRDAGEPVADQPATEQPPPDQPVTDQPTPRDKAPKTPTEHKVQQLPLDGLLKDQGVEISSLAWYKDHLILLMQYPAYKTTRDKARLLALSKQAILDHLDGKSTTPLQPKEIPFRDGNLTVKGYEGYEAIAFVGEQVFLTIEASPPSGMTGHIIKGTMATDLSALTLDPKSIQPLPSQSKLSNFSDETLLVTASLVGTIHEANGANVNASPLVRLFGLDLKAQGTASFPHIEYRITDATTVDSQGRFWAINYLFPGEKEMLKIGPDKIVEMYGEGETHKQREQVERLLEFSFSKDGVKLTGTAPIQLYLPNDDARNWEGIVRLDDRGFLLATDAFPKTMLGFVPKPK